MFNIDNSDITKLELDLERLRSKAFPFATRATVNGMAFQGQKFARHEVRTGMTNRNAHTVRSIQVEQSRSLIVSRQAALLGSTEDYMEVQEFGGVKRKTGAQGVAITTAYAAGQTGKRTKLARKPNLMSNISLRRRNARNRMSRGQRNLVAVKEAATSGQKFIYMDTGKSRGIFRVTGGARNPSVKMVYDLSREFVTIPRNPWLKPSTDRVIPYAPRIYVKALEFQIKRQQIFLGAKR